MILCQERIPDLDEMIFQCVFHMEVIKMHSSPGGPIAILFMMVPLIVVPLIAIFGIPNLPTNFSSAATEESSIQFDSLEEDGIGESAAHQADAPRFDDEITTTESKSQDKNHTARQKRSASAMQGLQVNPEERQQKHQAEIKTAILESDSDHKFQLKYDDEEIPETQNDSTRRQRNGFTMSRRTREEIEKAHFEDSFNESEGEGEEEWITDEELLNSEPLEIEDAQVIKKSSFRLPWADQIKKLRTYGIKNYQLVPGSEPGEFLFRCVTVSPRNSRLVFRFESEAQDPLDAVSDVVRQVEEWYQKQN